MGLEEDGIVVGDGPVVGGDVDDPAGAVLDVEIEVWGAGGIGVWSRAEIHGAAGSRDVKGEGLEGVDGGAEGGFSGGGEGLLIVAVDEPVAGNGGANGDGLAGVVAEGDGEKGLVVRSAEGDGGIGNFQQNVDLAGARALGALLFHLASGVGREGDRPAAEVWGSG